MAVITPTTDIRELKEKIFDAVCEMYSDVAAHPSREFHFPTGRKAAEFVGYPSELLDYIPDEVIESFAGVGFPFKADVINKDDIILDIGSGSGTDIFIAAKKVGVNGMIYGIDITPAMIEKINKSIDRYDLKNIIVTEGSAEEIPMPDEKFDVVTSNGVLNLVPDEKKAFSEMYRVLKYGGRIQISDIVLSIEISEKSRSNPQLWAECIVGAMQENNYIEFLHKAGFKKVRIINRYNYFSNSSNESTKKTAEQFGAVSITITAIKK